MRIPQLYYVLGIIEKFQPLEGISDLFGWKSLPGDENLVWLYCRIGDLLMIPMKIDLVGGMTFCVPTESITVTMGHNPLAPVQHRTLVIPPLDQ